MKKIFHAALAVAMLGLLSSASAITIGNTGSTGDNCQPFGCTGTGGTYQQLYTSDKFTGPVSISAIGFYTQTYQYFENGTKPNLGNYTVSLSTTNTFGTARDSNLGADNTVVYQGTLNLDAQNRLILSFADAFVYDPTKGSLLLDVSYSNVSQNKNMYFVSDDGFQRLVDGATDGYGLVTEFITDSTAVPEPTSIALLLSGLVGLSACRRKGARS